MRSTGNHRFPPWRREFVVSVLICVLSVLPNRSAVAESIGLFVDPQGLHCDFEQPPLMGTTSVYVILKQNSGNTGAQFAMPIPACAPYTISAWSSDYIALGDPESGIAVGFGPCTAGDVVMLQVDLMRIGDPTTDACALALMPSPQSETGSVEVVDCAFNVKPAFACAICLDGNGVCPLEAPSNPSPPDGAVDMPLEVVLNCELHEPEFFSACVPPSVESALVYFGTDPNPPRAIPMDLFPYPARGLAPATTYYWRIVHAYPAHDPVSSPVWSFTTTSTPNPVEPSTWGRIKALYRQE